MGGWDDAVSGWYSGRRGRPGRMVCALGPGEDGGAVSGAASRLGVPCMRDTDEWEALLGSDVVIAGPAGRLLARALNCAPDVRPGRRPIQMGLLNCNVQWHSQRGVGLLGRLAASWERFGADGASAHMPGPRDGAVLPMGALFDLDCPNPAGVPLPQPDRRQRGRFQGGGCTGWATLDAHSGRAAGRLAGVLGEIPPGPRAGMMDAMLHHDWGKADRGFQDALLRGLPPGEVRQRRGTAWAKRRPRTRLSYGGPPHDLLGGCAMMCDAAPHGPLAAYLVMSHHGRFRCRIPGPVLARLPAAVLGGVKKGAVLAAADPARYARLFGRVWRRYGPFRLAHMEAVFRMADVGAEAG